MKKLQKGFTTPEQSKRLLELGLPVRSADCLSRPDGTEIGIYQPRTPCRIDEFIDYANKRYGRTYYIPVWSVGRLMEIYLICKTNIAMGLHFSSNDDWGEDTIEGMCDLFSAAVRCGYIDFTKLEN